MRRRFMINKAMKLENYLTFVCLSDGSSISFSNNVEYCIDNSIWNTLYFGTKIENIMKGTTVSFRLNNPIIDTTYGVGVFSTEGSFDLIGNIMSMLFYNEAIGHIDLTGFEKAFNNMFKNNNSLVDCSKLNLPATTLADSCYGRMFYGCTNLVKAPELPATTLAYACYYQMFEGCTSLTKAPNLLATELANSCYERMFYGCTNLNFIKMLATFFPESYYSSEWVYGVSPTGTFVKSKDATWDVVGDSGVPTGWTVIDDTFPTNEDGFPESTEFSFPLYLNFPKEPSYEDEYEVEYTLVSEILGQLYDYIKEIAGFEKVVSMNDNPMYVNGYRVTSIRLGPPMLISGIDVFDSLEFTKKTLIGVKLK